MKDPKKVKQGKRNRASGAAFELKVRKDLEEKGWIVSKYGNNIQLNCKICNGKMSMNSNKNKYFCKKCNDFTEYELTKQIPASPGRFRMMQTGFPDFICYRKTYQPERNNEGIYVVVYEIIFVEVKSNGYLSKIEKEKSKWYLQNNICSKFLIAKKIKIGRKVKIEYKEFTYT